MARYILVHIDRQTIMGQKLDSGGMRPFVSIAEAYETLAALPACRAGHGAGRKSVEGAKHEETGRSFNAWKLCEVSPVEKP